MSDEGPETATAGQDGSPDLPASQDPAPAPLELRSHSELAAHPAAGPEPKGDTQSAGSSAIAERRNGQTYLPIRTLTKTSHQGETLEGNELK